MEIEATELTDRENAIVNLAMEKALRMLPEVVVKLMEQKTSMLRIKEQFYKENEAFLKHKDIVASVIEEVEGKNPGKQYEDLLTLATPLIKARIGTIGSLDMKKGTRPAARAFGETTEDLGDL
jgi:DNA-directed RNA polymerase